MTPSQHQTQAETMLAAATTGRGALAFPSEPSEFDVIEVHTILSQSVGTGSHYQAAEAALSLVRPPGHVIDLNQINVALAHARLADR